MNTNIEDMNIGTLMYLEYLSKYDKDKLKNYVDFLPNEVFDSCDIEIEHFDRDESRDYSYGFRRNVTERYYTYTEHKHYEETNIENFKRWLNINYKILSENLETTYREYLKSMGKYNKKMVCENFDDYDEIEHEKKTTYKFITKM